MKAIIFILFQIFLAFNIYSQIPKGYYFKDIKGSKWLYDNNIKDSSLLTLNNIGLRKIDNFSFAHVKGSVWEFSDSLVIKYYNETTKEYNILITCNYINNEEDKTLSLILDNDKILEFDYNPISTGSYVGLYKKRSN